MCIFSGGTILAWGNNSRAQLGRIPARETRDADDKLVLLKSSKRVVRLPNTLHIALDVPSQVPGISTLEISYQSNDVSCFAGLVRPLSVIEKSPGELTLHYVLEHFYGLYRSASIMDKVRRSLRMIIRDDNKILYKNKRIIFIMLIIQSLNVVLWMTFPEVTRFFQLAFYNLRDLTSFHNIDLSSLSIL